MDRLYTMSCGCVYHSHHGYSKSCAGSSYVHSNIKTLNTKERILLSIHQESTTDITGVIAK